MNTDTKVSAGAMRAASLIGDEAYYWTGTYPRERVAEIIERETHAGEMERLLRIMTQRPISSRVLIQAGNEARTLLQRIEEGK